MWSEVPESFDFVMYWWHAAAKTFPFPNLADHAVLAAQIAAIAEELDAHRKRQQAAHATLTLTDMYNVLDALRLGRVLTPKEMLTHTNGLVSVLAELHDRLDALVLEAYGWSDLAPALVGRPTTVEERTSPWSVTTPTARPPSLRMRSTFTFSMIRAPPIRAPLA